MSVTQDSADELVGLNMFNFTFVEEIQSRSNEEDQQRRRLEQSGVVSRYSSVCWNHQFQWALVVGVLR